MHFGPEENENWKVLIDEGGTCPLIILSLLTEKISKNKTEKSIKMIKVLNFDEILTENLEKEIRKVPFSKWRTRPPPKKTHTNMPPPQLRKIVQ